MGLQKVPIVLKKSFIVPVSYYFHRIPHELSDFAVRLRKRHLLVTVDEQKKKQALLAHP